MVRKKSFQKKVETQLKKWKSSIDELKSRVDQAEASAKIALRDQMDSLHERREKAEKLLEDLKAVSEEAWENVKTGADHAWGELSRTAKKTASKVRNAIIHPNRDEEIRLIAYHLWLDDGQPAGRHGEHWARAEAIWQEQQVKSQAGGPAVIKPKSTTKRNSPGKKQAPRRRRAKKQESTSRSD